MFDMSIFCSYSAMWYDISTYVVLHCVVQYINMWPAILTHHGNDAHNSTVYISNE